MGALGDRIKEYEKVFNGKLIKNIPLLIRVDGKAFHTLTKNLNKPFDAGFINAMTQSAMQVAQQMQGFKLAYVQSDEVTFCLTDYDSIETEGWFGYKHQKVVSISAALMSVAFNHHTQYVKHIFKSLPVFDSRAFNVPRHDVLNAFLWRCKDWERNSLQMYCRSFFSHKELHGKNREMMHDMLHSIGKNWGNDLTNTEKNGTFIVKDDTSLKAISTIKPRYLELEKAFWHLF